jgi:hypothetical protein
MLTALLLAGVLAQDQPAPARVPPADDVSQQRLMSAIAALPPERSAEGGPEGWAGLKATEDLVLARLGELGLEPGAVDIGWRPRFRGEGGEQPAPEPPVFRNIIVDLPGKDLPHEVLLLSAHLDAVPGTPGADDDGTGVAALLEAATILRDRPMRRTVRLVFFNLEEVGLVGSRQYALGLGKAAPGAGEEAGAETRPETIIGMASLEMLGYFSDEPDSQKSPLPAIKGVFEPPTVGDFVAIVTTRGHAAFARRLDEQMRAGAPGLKTGITDFAPDLPHTPPDLLRSDHAPFLALGIPAVMVTDTANFRNPNYHKPTDTVDTLDAERFALVVRGIISAAQSIAEPAAPPDGE